MLDFECKLGYGNVILYTTWHHLMFAHLHMEGGKPHEITNVTLPISILSFSVFALAPSVMCL